MLLSTILCRTGCNLSSQSADLVSAGLVTIVEQRLHFVDQVRVVALVGQRLPPGGDEAAWNDECLASGDRQRVGDRERGWVRRQPGGRRDLSEGVTRARARSESEPHAAANAALRRVGRMPVPALTELRARRDEILRVAEARGAHNVRVFGSVARGTESDGSDVDFLVQMDDQRSLFDLGGLLMDLQDLLGCDVDVTTDAGLRPRVAQRILADVVEL